MRKSEGDGGWERRDREGERRRGRQMEAREREGERHRGTVWTMVC